MKFGFFPYSSLYYKAAQKYLDKKAAKGLILRKVFLGCIARFEKAEHPHHFVDLISAQTPDDDPTWVNRDYLQLCEDAGWEHIQDLRGMFLFRSKPGNDPLPIQTDNEIEWEQFWEKNKPRLRNTVVLLAALALLAFILILSPPSSWEITPFLLNNTSLLIALYWLLTLLYGLSSWIFSIRYLSRCKKAGQVEPPGQMATVLDGAEVFRQIFALLLIPLIFIKILLPPALELRSNMFEEQKTATVKACQAHPVVMAYDLEISDDTEDSYSRYLTLRRSFLCEYYNYSELVHSTDETEPPYNLTTERYECAFEFLSRWVFDQRAKETRNYFLWGSLEWEETALPGFEESYACRDGNYLLLQQGKVVALVGCSGLDLTTPENLEIVCDRLDLPPT